LLQTQSNQAKGPWAETPNTVCQNKTEVFISGIWSLKKANTLLHRYSYFENNLKILMAF
jgi:hypothetical protein